LPLGTLGKPARAEFLLWLFAVLIVVSGIVAAVRGALPDGIVPIILGLLIGPGGVSLFA
jgi:hypothetical protein